MDYLLKIITKKEKINYKKAFQKIFSTLSRPENFDKQERKFDVKKEMIPTSKTFL